MTILGHRRSLVINPHRANAPWLGWSPSPMRLFAFLTPDLAAHCGVHHERQPIWFVSYDAQSNHGSGRLVVRIQVGQQLFVDLRRPSQFAGLSWLDRFDYVRAWTMILV
jgi:hypothetical protein